MQEKKWHSSVSAYSSESSPNWSGNWSRGLAEGSLLYKPPDFYGRRVGARTPDLCRVEATLYQLSYAPISNLKKIRTARRRNLTLDRDWGANGKGAKGLRRERGVLAIEEGFDILL